MMKSCVNSWCKQSFEITDDDLTFIDSISPVFADKKYVIPPPLLCPDCRMQKRMAWRNERSIYPSQCTLCKKKIISMYSADKPYTVYCHECFWSDKWDPQTYAREFDFRRPFHEQFGELMMKVPLLALINTHPENSEYCHRIYDGRNNYLSFIALFVPENLLYAYYTIACKSCTDVSINQYCELCYETVDAERCYACAYSARIRNCRDSAFLEDCIGCSDCFGCKNLHQKQYCVFNEQKTRQEYETFLKTCAFSSSSFVAGMQEKAHKFFLQFPHRAVIMTNVENAIGSYIFNSRAIDHCFDMFECERMRYCGQNERSHDCRDCYGMGDGAFCYDGVTLGASTHSVLSAETLGCVDMFCCYACYNNSQNCFGCVGMKKAKYCIFNKQYSKEDYEVLMGKILEHLERTGEWGGFFPMQQSPFGYNESVAQEYVPLPAETVQERGWKWKVVMDEMPKVEKIIRARKLPDRAGDIPDDVLNWAIECEATNRPFRIIKQELDFYRSRGLPIPHLHPDERHRLRMARRNPRKLWDRECMKCKKKIQTTYAPERPEIVYCEDCYLKEVY